MKRYFIKIAYDGSDFFGWQTQPNERTVQDVLDDALSLILIEKEIKTIGCGRTDTGVHASCFYAHFELSKAIEDKARILYKLNNYLPHSIAVKNIIEVDKNAHARFDATKRSYQYFIHQSKDPFTYNFSYHLKSKLDLKTMNEAASLLLEVKDFASFSKSGSDSRTTICEVSEANWEEVNGQLRFTISADRFLRNMVRAIVGTLIEVGLSKISVQDFKTIIESKSRQNAGSSAPAQALFLSDIQYPYSLV